MKYVCVLSTDNYLEGVLVLNENLKQLKSKYGLLCLVNETIQESSKKVLEYFNIEYKEMPSIKYKSGDSYWKYTFDKINIFALTEYEKIVYLDSDLLILKNIDHLFLRDNFTMCSDFPCSEHLNSAIMVLKPNLEDYEKIKNIVKLYDKKRVKTIGDQDIIRLYYDESKIDQLTDDYNLMRIIVSGETQYYKDIYENVFKEKYKVYIHNREFENPTVIHYIKEMKPWMVDKPYEDEYYYEYRKYLDAVRVKEREYYISERKLLVVIYMDEMNDYVMESINSIKNQTYKNFTVLFVSNEQEGIRDYLKSNNFTNAIIKTKFDKIDKIFEDYDYITFHNVSIILRDDCYEKCIDIMFDYDLECINFAESYNPTDYFTVYKGKDEIAPIVDLIKNDGRNKIFKTGHVKNIYDLELLGVYGISSFRYH